MDGLSEFHERLAALGDFCSRERGDRALILTLQGIRALSGPGIETTVRALMPVWLHPAWDAARPDDVDGDVGCDLVTLVARLGQYPYHAAAGRDVRAVLACLREHLDERAQAAIYEVLPETERALFLGASACAYDASIGKFL